MIIENGKAPGVDQITVESIKPGGDVLHHHLHTLLQTIWFNERVPIIWRKAIIVPIFKKN